FYRRTEAIYQANKGSHDETMLNFAKHLSILGVLGGVVDVLDQILVFHFAGAAQLAIFSFATALPDQLRTPTKTLDSMVSANFAHRSDEEIHHSMGNKFFWYFIGATCMVAGYIVLAPFFFKLFFPAYTSSVFYSQLYVLGTFAIAFDPIQSYFGTR